MERLNAEALAALTERHNVQLRSFPTEVVTAARKVAAEVLGEVAARSDMARKVHDSYAAFRERTAPWSRVSIKAVLEAREGEVFSPRVSGERMARVGAPGEGQ